MDLVFTIGTYALLAMAFNAFGLDLDPGLPDEGFDSTERVTFREGDDLTCRTSPSPRRGAGPSIIPSSAPPRSTTRDSIDPAYYEAERTAIFKRTWLNVGRVEQVPETGSYFTRELAVADTSLIIVRGKDGQIRAFHNMCRHRGNKLVWNDYPGEEVKGTCRQFTCKYHAWRYSLDGELTFIQQEERVLRPRQEPTYGLKAVRCEVWEGFIFVNLDPAAAPLADYLGEMAKGLEGYPFGEMTEVFTYRAEVGSNWKLFIDAFAEFYHAPVLHQKQAVKDEADKLLRVGFEGLHYELHDPHSMISSWGGMSPPKDLSMVKPIERVLRSGLFGPWDRPDIEGLDPLPPGVNPARHQVVGRRLLPLLPQLHAADLGAGLVPDLPLLADRGGQAHLRGEPVLRPGQDGGRAAAPTSSPRSRSRSTRLQDANTLEATQTHAQEPRRHRVPAVRPGTAAARPAQGHRRLRQGVPRCRCPLSSPSLEPFSDWILATERERYAKRLASSMAEMQAFYDAAFPLLEPATTYLERFPLDDLPEPERNLLLLMMSLVMVSFPVEVWKQPRVPDSGAAYLDLVNEPAV